MARIIDYQVLRGQLGTHFDDAMNAKIKDGWQPVGEVQRDIGNTSYIMQVIVRYAPDDAGEIAYVLSRDVADLSEKVANRAQEGWALYGTVAMAVSGEAIVYCQTMVRPKITAEEN